MEETVTLEVPETLQEVIKPDLVDRLITAGQTINHLNLVLNKKTRKINRMRETIMQLAADVKYFEERSNELAKSINAYDGLLFGTQASPTDCG